MNNDLAIANTIRSQIGHGAFVMLGASNLLGGPSHLQFKIGRNVKRVTHITVTLDPSDTYTVRFTRVGRSPNFKITEIAECAGVYADSLHAVIERHTDLCVSL